MKLLKFLAAVVLTPCILFVEIIYLFFSSLFYRIDGKNDLVLIINRWLCWLTFKDYRP